MKVLCFLPAIAFANNPGGGQVGKNYAQDYTIAETGDGFQCDIDGNATYSFEITSDNAFIREVKMEGKEDTCHYTSGDSELEITDGGKKATVTLNANSCFDGPTSTKEGYSGEFQIYVSADDEQDLFFGKITQNMLCTMKRDHKVTYTFAQIMLDIENEGDLADGEKNGYVLSRKNRDYSNMTDDTKNVTSGEKLYFQVDPVGNYEDFDFDVKACSVSKGDDHTYFLSNLYQDQFAADGITALPCVETFLDTKFEKHVGFWRFTYEAFTFTTDNESDVILTCDIKACNDTDLNAAGYCDVNSACETNTNLSKVAAAASCSDLVDEADWCELALGGLSKDQVEYDCGNVTPAEYDRNCKKTCCDLTSATPPAATTPPACLPHPDDTLAHSHMKQNCETGPTFPGILKVNDSGVCYCDCDMHDKWIDQSKNWWEDYYWYGAAHPNDYAQYDECASP